MATFTQTYPSLRAGSPAVHEKRGVTEPERRPHLVTIPSRKPAVSVKRSLALFPHESEDARITGATRSLYRRLLALNLPGADTASQLNVTTVRKMTGSFVAPKSA
jgi:hypothetical protein